MTAPCEQNGYDRGDQQPPFLFAPAEAKPEHEKEDGNRSHVHRTGSERLRPPVEREGFHYPVETRLSGPLQQSVCLGAPAFQFSGRGASVEVRNKQVRRFLYPV